MALTPGFEAMAGLLGGGAPVELIDSGASANYTSTPQTSVSTTSKTFTAVAGDAYYCFTMSGDNPTINITNSMGFSGATLLQNYLPGSGVSIRLYRMDGTPTGDGTITATKPSTTNDIHLHVIQLRNLGAQHASTSHATSASGTYGSTVSAKADGVIFYGAYSQRNGNPGHTATGSNTELTQVGDGGPNGRVSAMSYQLITSDSTPSWGGTYSPWFNEQVAGLVYSFEGT